MNYWRRLQWIAGIAFVLMLAVAAWLSEEPKAEACSKRSDQVRCMPEIR